MAQKKYEVIESSRDRIVLQLVGKSHKPTTVKYLEIPDSLFNHKSAIPSLDSANSLIHCSLTVFCHSKDNAEKDVVFYGHSDTSGDPSYNYDLSEYRGKAMKALFDNNAETWLDAVGFGSKVEDYQTTMKSLSLNHGWPTDPGTVDNQNGPKTINAVKSFQKTYNSRFSEALTVAQILRCQCYGN